MESPELSRTSIRNIIKIKSMIYNKKIKITLAKIKNLNLNAMDEDKNILKKAFDIAFDNDIFALYKYSAPLQEKYKAILLSEFAKISGSLAFLAIQILAANAIMNKNDFSRKERFFKKKCGIAINHLHLKTTQVQAKKVKNGYLLTGALTWASGYGIFDSLLIGFHHKEYELEVLSSFKNKKGFIISSACNTFVGYSINTVNIELKDFFVKDKNIVSSNNMGNYSKNRSLAKSIHYCIYGLGKAAINDSNNTSFKTESKLLLKKKQEAVIACTDAKELSILRVELFLFVQELITTAMVLNGGKSIFAHSTFQRYYREIIMFNTNGLNQNLKDIFLLKYESKS